MQEDLLQDKGLIGHTNVKNGEKTAMKEQWYGDSRDLIKWSVLLHIAEKCSASKILQIAYLRPSKYNQIMLSDKEIYDMPLSIRAHFRNLKSIESIDAGTNIEVFSEPFNEQDRGTYLEGIIQFISEFSKERCIVFLDPDTGLQPQKRPNGEHILCGEVRDVWNSLKEHDILVFYQHKTNRNGSPWIEDKRIQLAKAIGVKADDLGVASSCYEIDRDKEVDVVFYFMQKAQPAS